MKIFLRIFVGISLIPLGISLVALEICAIGAIGGKIKHFIYEATAFQFPKWSGMLLDCFAIFSLILAMMIFLCIYCLLVWFVFKKN